MANELQQNKEATNEYADEIGAPSAKIDLDELVPGEYSQDPEDWAAVGMTMPGSDNSVPVRGLKSGFETTKGLGYGAAAALGDAVGSESLKQRGIEGYQRSMDKAALYRRDIPEFTDLIEGEDTTVSDVIDYVFFTVGNVAPTIAASVVSGGAGGILARVGGKAAINKMVVEQVAKGVSRDVATKAVGSEIAKRMAVRSRIGQAAGAYAASTGMELGSIYPETGDVGVSVVHAAVAGALDMATPFALLGKFGAGKLADKAKNEVVRSIPFEVAKSALIEGGTEGLQSLIEQHAKYWVDNNGQSLLNDLGEVKWKDVINSTAAGVIGGTGFGGVTEVTSRIGQKPAPAKEPEKKAEKAKEPGPVPEAKVKQPKLLGLPAPPDYYVRKEDGAAITPKLNQKMRDLEREFSGIAQKPTPEQIETGLTPDVIKATKANPANPALSDKPKPKLGDLAKTIAGKTKALTEKVHKQNLARVDALREEINRQGQAANPKLVTAFESALKKAEQSQKAKDIGDAKTLAGLKREVGYDQALEGSEKTKQQEIDAAYAQQNKEVSDLQVAQDKANPKLKMAYLAKRVEGKTKALYEKIEGNSDELFKTLKAAGINSIKSKTGVNVPTASIEKAREALTTTNQISLDEEQTNLGKLIAERKEKQRKYEIQKKRKRVDPIKDDLPTAIKKKGGINRQSATDYGVDPASFKDFRGQEWLFPAGGKGLSFDAMAEEISQEGDYLSSEDKTTELIEKVHGILRGEDHRTSEGHAWKAEQDYKQKRIDQALNPEIDVTPESVLERDHSDLPAEYTSEDKVLGELVYSAVKEGVPQATIDKILDDKDSRNTAAQIFSAIHEARNGTRQATSETSGSKANERGSEEEIPDFDEGGISPETDEEIDSFFGNPFKDRSREDYIFNESGELHVSVDSIAKIALDTSNGDKVKAIKSVRGSMADGHARDKVIKLIEEDGFELETQTEAQLRAQATSERIKRDVEAKREKKAEDKAKADSEADDFVLSGSNRPADVATSRGQNDLFGAKSQNTDKEVSGSRDNKIEPQKDDNELSAKERNIQRRFEESVNKYNVLVEEYKTADEARRAELRPQMDALNLEQRKLKSDMQKISMTRMSEGLKKEADSKFSAMEIGTKIGMIGLEKSDKSYWQKIEDNRWQRTMNGSVNEIFKTNAEMEGGRIIDEVSSSEKPNNSEPMTDSDKLPGTYSHARHKDVTATVTKTEKGYQVEWSPDDVQAFNGKNAEANTAKALEKEGYFKQENTDGKFSLKEPTEKLRDGSPIPETGKPIELFYAKNLENTENFGSTYAQDIEPSGDYLVVSHANLADNQGKNWEYGTVRFENPLVLKTEGTVAWKKELSARYGNKKGKRLSKVIQADGYDAIITYDEYGLSETVSLGPKRNIGGKKINNDKGKLSISDQTGTPKFKIWFGDSVIVDAEGKPLVVYHGTADHVEAFDLDHQNRKDSGWLGTGVYLTDHIGLAKRYAEQKRGNAAPHVIHLYAKLENPYMATMNDKERLKPLGRKGADEFTTKLISEGYDGVILEMNGGREIVVFDTAGVKSATDNNGEFNPADTRIKYDLQDQFRDATKKITEDLATRLEKLGISDKVVLKLKDRIEAVANGKASEADGRYLRGIIEVALSASDQTWTLNHEVIHALRDLGLIRDAEWRALSTAAKADTKRMDSIRKRYEGLNLSEEAIIEEAIADMFADWVAKKVEVKGFVRSAFNRITEFFKALSSAIKGNGFNTVDSVFSSIDRGDVGRREASDAKGESPSFALQGAQPNPYDRAFDSLGDKDKTIFDRAKKMIKREFLPQGLLPDSVFKEKLERDFEINTFEFDISNRLGHFEKAIEEGYQMPYRKLDEATKEKLNAALSSAEPDMTIPESVREEIYKMRLVIKNLSKDYAELLQSEIDSIVVGMSDGERVLYDAMLRAAEIIPDDNTPAAKAKATKQYNKIIDEAKEEAGLGKDTMKAMSVANEAASKNRLLNIILGNLDKYVHRSYRAFDDPKWPRKVSRETYDAAASYLENRMAEDEESGVTPEIQRRVSKILELMLEEGTAFDSMEAFIKESKLGAKDLSILIKRKDIAPEIRALLGEYTEPEINFTKSVTKMTRLVMNQKFLNKVKEIGLEQGFLFTKENAPLDATRKIAADASEVYAPLNGYYTYPEVEQAFRDALGKEQMADWYRTIVRLNGLVKFGKTVLSPTTAMRNWMSSSFFAMASGHFDFTQMKKSISSIKEYFTHGEGKDGYLKKMKRLGVIYDTPYAGEMMDLLADSNLEHDLFDKAPFYNARKALDYAQKFYQYGDDFWKIMGFENEKAMQMKYNNLSEEEAETVAAERIRNTYPTYSMTGRFVQKLRRFPLVGTFVSFPAEIIRTSYHVLNYLKQDMKSNPALGRRRAVGLAIVAGMTYGIQAITMAMLGMDDDDEESFRDLAAPWQRNSNIMVLGRDEKGNLRLVDLSFLDPYNYWKRPINAIMRDQPMGEALKDAAREVLQPFFGQDIAFGAIMDVMNNEKQSGGRIFNPQAPVLDQTADIANHLRKAVQPGIASNMERMVGAMSDKVSPSGTKYTMSDELAALAGWRITTFDPRTAIYYQAFEFQDKKADATKILTDLARNPNNVSDEKIVSAYQNAQEVRITTYEKMLKLVSSAMNQGLTKIQIVSILRDSGISKEDAIALANGRIPHWRSPSTTMKNAIKKANVLFGKNIAEEFKRRQIVIEQQFRADRQR